MIHSPPGAWTVRSALFVPGDDERKLARATGAGADALIYDLEDAVAGAHKARARELVCAALRAPDAAPGWVRVNGLDTPWGAQDVRAVAAAGAQAVLLPKCESAAQLAAAAALLEGTPTRLIALIETPAGVFDLAALGTAGGRLVALGFGHADFCHAAGLPDLRADVGLAWHARCQVVLGARARGLAALDCVCMDVRDAAVFRADAQLGRDLGYDGKLCIHPAQVPLAHAVYAPSAPAVEHARRVLDAWAQARAQGLGVIALDGAMVDAPVVAAAQRVLDRAGRSPDAASPGAS